MYRLLINNNKRKIKSISKWEESEVQFSELEWENIFELPFKISQESKLQQLLFRISHRLFLCNYYLHRLKLVDSPLCVFCKRDLETIDHLFVECPCVKELWCRIEDWLLEKLDKYVGFNKQAILFGKFANRNIHKVENLIILIVKHYINNSNFSNTSTCKLNIETQKKIISDRIVVEKFLLLKNCKYNEFERYWHEIYDKLVMD